MTTAHTAKPDRSVMPTPPFLTKLTLRARVMAVLILVHVAVMAITAWLLVLNARAAVDEEIRTNLGFARNLSVAIIGSRMQFDRPEDVMGNLQRQLPQARHVRLMLVNAVGNVIWPTETDTSASAVEDTETSVPRWFRRFIAPPVQFTSIPISVGLTTYGALVITSEPSDEIEEIWADFRGLFILMVLADGALLVLVRLLIGRALAPIAKISAGLEELEQGRYQTRLATVPVPDLRQIGERFNALAARLEATTHEKERLSRQMLTLQDDERKLVALELHDEFGPCLFGIRVDARAIQAASKGIDPQHGEFLVERSANILSIVDRLQQQSRSTLKRLRPMALGQLPLTGLLENLIDGFRSHELAISRWSLTIPDTPTSFGETIDLTIYRLVQECLTNAVRHAKPSEIDIKLVLEGKEALTLEVGDDGRGLPDEISFGLGLTGMRQRVELLGGHFEMRDRPRGGTLIKAWIPLLIADFASPTRPALVSP